MGKSQDRLGTAVKNIEWLATTVASLVESARIAQRREHAIHAVRAWAIPRPPTSRPIRFRVPVVGGRAAGAGSGGACRPHTLPLPSLASCRRRASGSRLRSGLPPGIRVDPVTARPPPGIRALVARHRPRPPPAAGERRFHRTGHDHTHRRICTCPARFCAPRDPAVLAGFESPPPRGGGSVAAARAPPHRLPGIDRMYSQIEPEVVEPRLTVRLPSPPPFRPPCPQPPPMAGPAAQLGSHPVSVGVWAAGPIALLLRASLAPTAIVASCLAAAAAAAVVAVNGIALASPRSHCCSLRRRRRRPVAVEGGCPVRGGGGGENFRECPNAGGGVEVAGAGRSKHSDITDTHGDGFTAAAAVAMATVIAPPPPMSWSAASSTTMCLYTGETFIRFRLQNIVPCIQTH